MPDEVAPGENVRDALLPAKKIAAETRRRLSESMYETISPKVLDDFEADGWVVDRRNRSSIRVRKPKPHDVAFEDRVWAVFAKLQFGLLNRDRHMRIPYGKGANETTQIDVFAADDEVVLVIECKSLESTRAHQFKKEVEAIQGTRPGVIAAIRREFPGRKMKFILATNNCFVSRDTRERIEAADIVHMDEDAIDYYLDLAQHLGKAARYQLLGSLFANQKIPGLDPRVPAIQGRMGGLTYYSFAIEPGRLLKMAYILHRNRANFSLMPTYQRLIRKSRLKRVSDFVEAGGFFPNSIILNIDSGRRNRLQFDPVGRVDGEAKLGILHLPQTYRAAYVIDGQHRLYGYADSARAETDLVPVVAFVDMPRADQVGMFMQINENQQAVPKNLRNTLNADLLWESPDLTQQLRALKLRVAQYLGEQKGSPLLGRIIIGENPRTATRCITIDAISRGLDRGNFLGSFSKSEVKTIGTLYRGSNDATFDLTTEVLESCLWFMRTHLESQFALGQAEGGFVFMNNGIEALLRVFSDVVDHLIKSDALRPLEVEAKDISDASAYYLDPLVEHLASLDPEEASQYRRLYGSGGATRYWRQLQLAIREARPEFDPPGLTEWEESEAKAYNLESQDMVQSLEQVMKDDIRLRLENRFGARWYQDGVPRKVREVADKVAAERNLDRDPDEQLSGWDCLYLIHLHAVLTQDHTLWVEAFRKRYTKPGEESKPGGWKAAANWIQQLNEVRNDLVHGRSVTPDSHEFLVTLTTWLVRDQADNEL